MITSTNFKFKWSVQSTTIHVDGYHSLKQAGISLSTFLRDSQYFVCWKIRYTRFIHVTNVRDMVQWSTPKRCPRSTFDRLRRRRSMTMKNSSSSSSWRLGPGFLPYAQNHPQLCHYLASTGSNWRLVRDICSTPRTSGAKRSQYKTLSSHHHP